MLLLLLQLASPPAPPAPPPPSQQHAAIMADDYPPEALENGWQGDVAVDLTIGTGGRPIACKVIHSSSHDVLDQATCRIFLARARFSPALNDAGKPVESHFKSHLDWRIGL